MLSHPRHPPPLGPRRSAVCLFLLRIAKDSSRHRDRLGRQRLGVLSMVRPKDRFGRRDVRRRGPVKWNGAWALLLGANPPRLAGANARTDIDDDGASDRRPRVVAVPRRSTSCGTAVLTSTARYRRVRPAQWYMLKTMSEAISSHRPARVLGRGPCSSTPSDIDIPTKTGVDPARGRSLRSASRALWAFC